MNNSVGLSILKERLPAGDEVRLGTSGGLRSKHFDPLRITISQVSMTAQDALRDLAWDGRTGFRQRGKRQGSGRTSGFELQRSLRDGLGPEGALQDPPYVNRLEGRATIVCGTGFQRIQPFRNFGEPAYHNDGERRSHLLHSLKQRSVALLRFCGAEHHVRLELLNETYTGGMRQGRNTTHTMLLS
jgi:hypothetical protein